jgi:hypothetical protein
MTETIQQTLTPTILTESKPVKVRGKNGGARPGAGRKRRMEEHEIIERLTPMADIAFKVLRDKVAEGDMKAIQIFMSYFIGLPTQKVESKIEGQLNQVSIEVIKPNIQVLNGATN